MQNISAMSGSGLAHAICNFITDNGGTVRLNESAFNELCHMLYDWKGVGNRPPSHARITTPAYTVAPHASGAKADDNE